MKTVTIYSDGACSGNPGAGGYASILIYNGIEKIVTGSEENTTNNKMELMGAISGLKTLKESCIVKLYSDSAYLINAFNNDWITFWQNNNWKTASKKPVKNVELWQELIELNNKHKIEFIKVTGHADNEYNNRCDKLAVNEYQKYLK